MEKTSLKTVLFVSLFYLQLEFKKTVLDRMIHLLSRGYVVAVISYINSCLEKQNADNSLIRHFVTEVSEIRLDLLSKTANVYHCFMLISVQINCSELLIGHHQERILS